jgi:bifunctional non-homologous end joining protein LigD
MLQRTLPAGFVPPCLPGKTDRLPSGREWLHEINHDGFRVIARKNGAQVRLYSRPGNDLTYRFLLIVETLARLRSRSCIIDGGAVACDDNGVTSFNRVRYRYQDESIFLYAFDLIELNGDDLRRDPLERRKTTLEMILTKAGLASGPMSISKARPYFGTPANSALKASCRNGRTLPIVPAGRPIG